MEKGIGKCIVCQGDEMAVATVSVQVTAEDASDLAYFEDMKAYACTHCGFIQLTSKKVM